MKTTFVSQNVITSGNKRKFQKPNILRRKTKALHKEVKPRTFETNLITLNIGLEQQFYSNVEGHVISSSKTYDRVQPKLVQGVVLLDSYSGGLNSENVTPNEPSFFCNDGENTVINMDSVVDTTPNNAEISDSQTVVINENNSAPVINIESFLNNNTIIESIQEQDSHTVISSTIHSETNDWSIGYSEAQQIIIEDCNFNSSELASVHSITEAANSVPCVVEQDQATDSSILVPIDSLQQLGTFYILPSFECDKEGCNKSFKSKKRLTCHKRTHISRSAVKQPRPHTVECPAHKPGETEPCGSIFLNRDALTEHIKQVHTLDDAAFLCKECGRRFFYSLGLRAHSRAHMPPAPKPSLVCGWPGCGRLFQQPCRLREHQRAHTGDKPYPCNYPNCKWSFRNASKLMRHARRHTGERRHECEVCGHAFQRREHVRDHAARHHAKPKCKHTSCLKDTKSSICKHKGTVKKVDEAIHSAHLELNQPIEELNHLYSAPKSTTKTANKSKTKHQGTIVELEHSTEVEPNKTTEIEDDTPWRVSNNETNENTEWQCAAPIEDDWYNNTQVVSQGDVDFQADTNLQAESDIQAKADLQAEDLQLEADLPEEDDSHDEADSQEETDEGGSHAARTHCTWPLQSRPDNVMETIEEPHYTLQDDVQVELSEEGSESNTYTIRSDLFLHGNLLTNEDSEHIPSVSVCMPGAIQDTGLSLLDAHPTIDLMQEDLMYTDSAVDESSFRVLLLNGDDLV